MLCAAEFGLPGPKSKFMSGVLISLESPTGMNVIYCWLYMQGWTDPCTPAAGAGDTRGATEGHAEHHRWHHALSLPKALATSPGQLHPPSCTKNRRQWVAVSSPGDPASTSTLWPAAEQALLRSGMSRADCTTLAELLGKPYYPSYCFPSLGPFTLLCSLLIIPLVTAAKQIPDCIS